MTMRIIFGVVTLVVWGAALGVVTTPNLVHAALWLVLTLFGVAVVFVLLNATFLAVAQVVIYIGAIAILFIFAVMLTRRVMKDTGPQTNPGWWLAALIAILLFAGLTAMLWTWPGFFTALPELPENVDPVRALGTALVSPDLYVIPFELASILLLAGLIGAIVVAWERK